AAWQLGDVQRQCATHGGGAMKTMLTTALTVAGFMPWTAHAAETTRPGIRLEAFDAGLALVARMLKDELAAAPIDDMPLGPIAGEMSGGVTIAVGEATLDATIAELAITSHPDTFKITIGLEQVRIDLPVM